MHDHCLYGRTKKISLVSVYWSGENFFITHPPAESKVSQNIFLISKNNKQTNKQTNKKTKNQKKQKKTKEEKRISPENQLKK